MPHYAPLPKINHFYLKPHCTDLLVKYEWLPNLPDFNHLTISLHCATLQTFYILELKSAQQQIRDDLPQTFAISSECICFGWW